MRERKIGIRELKSKLSEYLRDVKMGATVLITERGHRIARIVPETDSLAERINTLRKAGSIQWSGRRLGRAKPVSGLRGERTVADILVEDRD